MTTNNFGKLLVRKTQLGWQVDHKPTGLMTTHGFRVRRAARHFASLIAGPLFDVDNPCDGMMICPIELSRYTKECRRYADACESRDHDRHPVVYSHFPTLPVQPSPYQVLSRKDRVNCSSWREFNPSEVTS